MLPVPASSLSVQIRAVHACDGRHSHQCPWEGDAHTTHTRVCVLGVVLLAVRRRGDVAATGGTVSTEMTREPAVAVCVSTQSHAEWLLCMCVLSHVGAASHGVTQAVRASTKW